MIKVYQYHYVDFNPFESINCYKLYKTFYSDSCEFFSKEKEERNKLIKDKYLNERRMIKELFKNAGWEGDGKLNLIWIPSFVNFGDDTYGTLVWHVQQSNNGTTFVGIDEKYEINPFVFRFED